MAAAICGHLRLKGEAAKLRGRRICCSFGDESLTIKGEVSTFLAVQRSAFGENWRQRGNVLKPTLVLRDGACLLYTSDAADDMQCVDLGGRRIIKKKK